MSDVAYQDNDPEAEFDPAQFVLREQRRAVSQPLAALEDDPEKAARAATLSEATGTPPALIYGDLENFEKQHKAALTTSLLRNNKFLADYAQSSPLADKISNDDWGQLDTVSEAISKLRKQSPLFHAPESILGKAFEGFKHGVDVDKPIGHWYSSQLAPRDWSKESTNDRLIAALGQAGWTTLGLPIELGMRLFSGVIGAIGPAVDEAAQRVGASESTGRRLGADIQGAIEQTLMGLGPNRIQPTGGAVSKHVRPKRDGVSPDVADFLDKAKGLDARREVDDFIRQKDAQNPPGTALLEGPEVDAIRKGIITIKPYIDAGKEPPVGLRPEIDKLKAEEAKLDVDNLYEAMKEADKSKTKERNPDMFADFIRQHTDGEVGVSAVKVRELYGDKVPAPEDGLLGWVPGLAEKLAAAEATGGDVYIPVADWLSKLDPKVAKELKDHVRVREGAPTIEETKVAAEQQAAWEAFHGDLKEIPSELSFEMANASFHGGQRLFPAKATLKDSTGRVTHEATFYPSIADETGAYHSVSDKPRMLRGDLYDKFYDKDFVGDKRFDLQKIENFTRYAPGEKYSGIGPAFYREIAKQVEEKYGAKLHVGVSGETSPTARRAHKVLEEAGYLERVSGDEAVVKAVRKAAALEPAIIAERKLTMERNEAASDAEHHHFNFLDKTGQIVGGLDIAEEKGGKRLYVDHVNAGTSPTEQINAIGPRNMRAVLEQLAEQFPNAETIEGARVSGAREKSGKEDIKASIDLNKVREKVRTRKKPVQLEMTEMTRMEDRAVFEEASAVGLTVDQYKRFQALIAKRRLEDIEWQTKRALEDAKRRLSPEWKAHEAELRPAIVDGINSRPDIAADNLLRTGELGGEKLEPRPRINEEFLTEADKASLQPSWITKSGMHPDDLASLTGFASGADMLAALRGLAAERGTKRPETYKRDLVSAELERQMEAKFGRLAENIIEEAKEHVLGETQLDLLYEGVLARATEADVQLPIPKAALKKAIIEGFETADLRNAKSDKFLADAGRAGREERTAFLKGDVAEAFKQAQRQFIATVLAKEAVKFEKLVAQFEKTAKRLGARENKAIEPAFNNYIHELLAGSGVEVKRSPVEIATAIEGEGYKSLEDFVNAKNSDGWELAVAENLQKGPLKDVKDMTVAEFREFKDAIDSLAHVGREVHKIEIAGEKKDFAEFREGVLANIRSLPVRDKTKGLNPLYRWDAELVRMEEVMKDLDVRKEAGPLWNAVIRPMMDSKFKEYNMLEQLKKDMDAIKGGYTSKWQRTLGDTIPQDFFHDSFDGGVFDLNRESMIQIMLNFGNRSNIDKFTRGYTKGMGDGYLTPAELEAKMWDLFDRHATAEDWQFVQRIWDLFEGWRKESDTMYRNLSGVAPKWVEFEPFQTRHGKMKGGYFPIIYDKRRSDITTIEDKSRNTKGTFEGDYFRATTGAGYTKTRTGAAMPIQFQDSLERVAGRMQQIIHDVSYRDAVINVGKVLYDKEIRGAIRKHYGMEYDAQLIPWLKDAANHFNANEETISWHNAVMRRARTNLMIHALGGNLKVILSPDMGTLNPVAMARTLSHPVVDRNLAMEHSREIPHILYNMDRDFREQLEGMIHRQGLTGLRADIARWSFYPISKLSQGFRIVTFVEKYKTALSEGKTEADAAAIADSFVRTRHGAAGIPDLPAIMRNNEASKMITIFGGYFNAMYNWSRQIPGNIRRGEYIEAASATWGTVAIGSIFGALLFNQSKESDSWFKTIAKAVPLYVLSNVPLVREAASYFIEGHQNRSPLTSLFNAVGSILNDTKKVIEGKVVEKPVQHIANVVGLTTPLPLGQVGKTGQFAYDVAKNRQKPRNIIEWMRGIIHGEARLKP